MASTNTFKSGPVRVPLDVFLGQAENPVGRLIFVKDGQREFSQFAYSDAWLTHPRSFDVSPDLSRVIGYQLHKPAAPNDSCFFGALADTEPDAWGRRVIARAHAKARAKDAALGPLTEVDYLAAVDDFSRVGALRLRNGQGQYLRIVADGERTTPAFLELAKILSASRAFELSQETSADLAYLQGKGTSLGGMRPKCTLQDADGTLCLGKFPSVGDERAVTRGEVLALHLARLAGIESASARVVMVQGDPVAIIKRFDRSPDQQRIPYISGASLLQARRGDEHSYTEILDVMRAKCENFSSDARQLWRRLVLNHLITNVDDHLQNIGFLYSGHNLWRLSPAFDLNPFPDKAAESKTWLSEDTGPITSVGQLMAQAFRFALSPVQAQAVLAEVLAVVVRWKEVAVSADVGLQASELADFRPAFEHAARQEAQTLLA
ncbi:type II toxin-antitoxin system HipA family toxin [Limnohabitans sp. Rim8]|uniref:type II toxin-antitoxin system HipA family toxin n=1 Tax=Limnohabitans sp. Rim8 TaxID=1100718 RepID=UPI0026269EE2|nr:HipA domain-containing protein [Limnohabitans sp. Rim8]